MDIPLPPQTMLKEALFFLQGSNIENGEGRGGGGVYQCLAHEKSSISVPRLLTTMVEKNRRLRSQANQLMFILTEIPCCRPCANSGGYEANITIPSTCEKNGECAAGDDRCCRGTRVEGCSCPAGQFFNGKKCVEQKNDCEQPCTSTTISTSSMSSTRLVEHS